MVRVAVALVVSVLSIVARSAPAAAAPNRPPVAVADAFTVARDGTLALPVGALLANDVDPDGDLLQVVAVRPIANGTVTRTSSTITFRPLPGFTGVATFEYTVSDRLAVSAALVRVTVVRPNRAPTAAPDAATTDEDAALVLPVAALLGNDRDPDGDPLAVTAVAGPRNGTVALAGGVVRFVPVPDFHGEAGFAYTISDGAATATAAVTVAVRPVPDAPVTTLDELAGTEDVALVVDAALLTGNDTDADGDALVVESVVPVAGGWARLDRGVVELGGDPEQSGVVDFVYVVSDGTRSATGALRLTLAAVDDPPIGVHDYLATDEDVAATTAVETLLANDVDLEGQPLTVTGVVAGDCGSAALADGVVTFTPLPDFAGGCVAFTYLVSDGTSTEAVPVAFDVVPVDDPPVLLPWTWDGVEDVAVSIGAWHLVAGAVDVDSPGPLRVVAVQNPFGGTVELVDDVITFTPLPDFHGLASVEYLVSDGLGTPALGVLLITVEAVNDAPRPAPDRLAAVEDTELCVDQAELLGNDVDVDSAHVWLRGVHAGVGGAVRDLGGWICFAPARDVAGAASFTYTIVDDEGVEATATVAVDVTPVDDPPVTRTLELTTDDTTPIAFVLPASDADGDPLTYTVATPAHGALRGTAPALTYVPAPGEMGPVAIPFLVSDGSSLVRGDVLVRVTGCGDWSVDAGEACDDGDRDDGDGCDATCTETRCGNGRVTTRHARSVTFTWLSMSCGPGATIGLWLDGMAGPRVLPVEERCSCGVAPRSVVVDDPEVLRGVGLETALGVEPRGFRHQLAWAIAEVDTGGVVEEIVLYETYPGQAAARDGNACHSDFVAPDVVVRDFVEECDDGNTRDGDGCSASCTVECDGTTPGCVLPCAAGTGARHAVVDAGRCFAAFDAALLFVDAEDLCGSHGGALPTIRDARQQAIVRSLAPGAAAWLDLFAAGDGYAWGGRTPLTFTAWAPGQPAADEHWPCVEDGPTGWRDVSCDEGERSVVCELPLERW